MKDYLRHDGYRYKRKLTPEDATNEPGCFDIFIADGYLCSKDMSHHEDEPVSIYFRPNYGYFAYSKIRYL